MSVTLTAETIGQLDEGAAGYAIDGAIAAAMRDAEDRGDDGKARTVTIKLTFVKKGKNVSTDLDVKNTIPPYRTNPTVGRLGFEEGKPAMVFSPHSSHNPEQMPLPTE